MSALNVIPKPVIENLRRALFIDDISKKVIFSDFANEYGDFIHLEGADWVPALGYTAKKAFDGHVLVTGSTDSGKSYLIRKMILNDRMERTVILFTHLSKEDKSLAGLKYIKFDPTSKYNWKWVKENDANKILIFDDVNEHPDNVDILTYRDTMLMEARHKDTQIVCVIHKLQDFWNSKVALTEARFIVTFPDTNKGQVQRFLDYELYLDKKITKEIVAMAIKEERQLIIHKFRPNAIATKESILKI